MTDIERPRNKVQNVYLNEETHATLKAFAKHKEMTIQKTAAELLEEMQPVMQEIVNAFESIKKGQSTQKVLANFMAKSLHATAHSLEDDKDEK